MADARLLVPRHEALRREAGLPSDFGSPTTLVFDAPTRTLIFSCTPASAVVGLPRYYVRRIDAPGCTSVLGLFAATRSGDESELVILSWVLGRASKVFFIVGTPRIPAVTNPSKAHAGLGLITSASCALTCVTTRSMLGRPRRLAEPGS
jgi:hypothetical protein